MKHLKKHFLYATFICSLQTGYYAHADLPIEETARNADTNRKLSERVTQTTERFANVCASVYVICKFWSIGADIRSYFFPSSEEKEKKLAIKKEYNELLAKNELQECLLKQHNELNSSGIPCACEDLVQQYAKAASIQKANEMKEAYKQFNTVGS